MAMHRINQRAAAAEDPLDAIAGLVRGNLGERRAGLLEHNPASLDAGARALAAGFVLAHRQVKAIRADRKVRFREKQMMGINSLGVEDLDAIGSEGELGAAVEVAILAVLAERRGFSLTPHTARVVDLSEVIGRTAAAEGALIQEFAAAVSPNSEGGTAVTLSEVRRLKERAKALRAEAQEAELAAGIAEARLAPSEGGH